MYFVKSYNFKNCYFLFRDNGSEIRIDIKDSEFLPEKPLKTEEINELKKLL